MERVADYVLLREFPRGNHGRVFMALTPPRLGVEAEHVAVKVLPRQATPEAFERLAAEVRLFASVPSPFLVRLHEAGHEQGLLYYSMEYFPEGSLGIRRRHFTRDELLVAVSHAARAAQALHDAGVVHGDVKPNNVLVRGRTGRLGDLGLAREIVQEPVGEHAPVGSLEYLDPALVRGAPPTPASDVWGLGATLHAALTGVGLYGRIPGRDLLAALRHVAGTPPRLAPGLRDDEARLIAACLADEPAARPTARQLAEHLEAAAATVAAETGGSGRPVPS